MLIQSETAQNQDVDQVLWLMGALRACAARAGWSDRALARDLDPLLVEMVAALSDKDLPAGSRFS